MAKNVRPSLTLQIFHGKSLEKSGDFSRPKSIAKRLHDNAGGSIWRLGQPAENLRFAQTLLRPDDEIRLAENRGAF
ncbi:MAG: hypothetical protein ACFB12_26030 [Leptolyngbyaceae cyanobacterium]